MENKIFYPAIFAAEESGGYSVRFPDVEGCFTQGENMGEALQNAREALKLYLDDCGKYIPKPSDTVTAERDEYIAFIPY